MQRRTGQLLPVLDAPQDMVDYCSNMFLVVTNLRVVWDFMAYPMFPVATEALPASAAVAHCKYLPCSAASSSAWNNRNYGKGVQSSTVF